MLTLQSEIQEVERLGLEEPLQLTQDITIKVGKDGAVKMSDSEVGQRFRQTTIVQEIYMGQFEVSDAALRRRGACSPSPAQRLPPGRRGICGKRATRCTRSPRRPRRACPGRTAARETIKKVCPRSTETDDKMMPACISAPTGKRHAQSRTSESLGRPAVPCHAHASA